jgi:hypothetical protein
VWQASGGVVQVICVKTQPVAELQLLVVQGSPSSQLICGPEHTPLEQVSGPVQALPSLQAWPFCAESGTRAQAPVAWLQTLA